MVREDNKNINANPILTDGIHEASNMVSIDLISSNEMNDVTGNRTLNGALLVAFDVLGGTFAINGGALEEEKCSMFYFEPDTLEWDNMEMCCTDFIHRLTLGNLNEFYGTFRWKDWKDDMRQVNINEEFNFY